METNRYVFEEGENVLVRRDLTDGEIYTGPARDGSLPLAQAMVTSSMSRFAGEFVTITAASMGGYYKIREDDGKWYWTAGMFEDEYDRSPIDLGPSAKAILIELI